MNFYNVHRKYYCGVDLHSKTMYVCILNEEGEVVVHRNLRNDPEQLLKVLQPYREDVVVACECVFAWYWLADLCAEEGIAFVLGHALYMKAIHGGKSKNDKIDSKKIAVLLRGGMLPVGYVYPKEMRAARDLMRRRLYFVRKRAELAAHVQLSRMQYNLPQFPTNLQTHRPKTREGIAEHFPDPFVRASIEADLLSISHYDGIIKALEQKILAAAKGHSPDMLRILQTVHGIGPILALTILYEMHTVERFPRVQDYLSYSRLVKCNKTSAGKNCAGPTGKRIGNAYLKWAFSEAAVRFLPNNDRGEKYVAKLQKKHGKGKALSILAADLGRAVYFMLQRKQSFNMEKFFAV